MSWIVVTQNYVLERILLPYPINTYININHITCCENSNAKKSYICCF